MGVAQVLVEAGHEQGVPDDQFLVTDLLNQTGPDSLVMEEGMTLDNHIHQDNHQVTPALLCMSLVHLYMSPGHLYMSLGLQCMSPGHLYMNPDNQCIHLDNQCTHQDNQCTLQDNRPHALSTLNPSTHNPSTHNLSTLNQISLNRVNLLTLTGPMKRLSSPLLGNTLALMSCHIMEHLILISKAKK